MTLWPRRLKEGSEGCAIRPGALDAERNDGPLACRPLEQTRVTALTDGDSDVTQEYPQCVQSHGHMDELVGVDPYGDPTGTSTLGYACHFC